MRVPDPIPILLGTKDTIPLESRDCNEICGGIRLEAGMVISPGYLEAARQIFDGSGAAGRPQNDADCGCAKTSDHPKNVLHGDSPDPLMFAAC